MAGFEKSYQYSYKDLNAELHDMGHAHPVSCVDCHDPDTMALRVTRPGFILGIQALAEGRDPGDLTTLDDAATLEAIRQAVD